MKEYKLYFQAELWNTAFIIASDFKTIAVFKPSSWRGKEQRNICVVWYSEADGVGLVRVYTGNPHKYLAIHHRNGSITSDKVK